MNWLNKIYLPIRKEMKKVDSLIESSFEKTGDKTIVNVISFLLESPGKRLRPALAILSAKATLPHKIPRIEKKLIKIASAIELIHMASLLHDDVIDHSLTRHNKVTVNSKWGKDVAITMGDYLYSVAFRLIAECDNLDVMHCLSSATKTMCEGELIQVCERNNLDLLKERYILIVKKKTASLFAASCQTGALVSNGRRDYLKALTAYGVNFGITFQIVDDYLDLTGDEKKIGRKP